MRRPIVYIAGGLASGLAVAAQTDFSWKIWLLTSILAAIFAGILAVISNAMNATANAMAAASDAKTAASTGTAVASAAETMANSTATAARVSKAAAIIVLLAALVAGGGLYYTLLDSRQGPLAERYGQECEVEAVALSVKPGAEDQQSDRMIVQAGKEKMMVSFQEKAPGLRELPGKTVKVRGLVEQPDGPVNPGLFDYSLYLKSIGIRTVMKAWSIEERDVAVKPVTNAIAGFKSGFWQLLSAAMEPEAAGILFGMLFGDKTYMGQEIYADFQKNGTAHILSVSGIHVGIIYACMEKTLGRGRKRSIPYNAAVVLLLFLYAALSEFTPSVMRAAFMIIVYILSKLLLRPYDFTACTAFTAFVLLLKNPFYIHNTGFILSYAAVFVLAVLLPAAQRALDEKIKEKEGLIPYKKKPVSVRLAQSFLPVVIIQIGLAPLTAYFFNYFSLAAFFVNIPVILAAGWMLPLGFLLMGVSFFMPGSSFLFHFLAFLTEYPIRLMIWMNHLTAKEGVGFFNVPSPSLKLVFLYYGVIFFLSCELGRTLSLSRIRNRYMGGGLAVLLAVTLLIPSGPYAGADIVLIDVGQGDAIHIRTPEGKNILIDGGGSVMKERDVGKDILYPYFMKNGVGKIDLAIITHLHEDHYGGVSSLSKLLPVKKAALFEGYRERARWIEKTLSIPNENIVYVKAGQMIRLGRGVSAQVLYPKWPQDVLSEDENENSLVLRVNYGGMSLMNTGDLLEAGEIRLVERYGGSSPADLADKADPAIDPAGQMKPVNQMEPVNQKGNQSGELKSDIIKIGHHGAKTSNARAFLEAVSPDAAVIQVGRRNQFGHPSPEVVQRLEDLEIPIYRNDEQGAVLIDMNGRFGKKRLRILEMKEKMWHNY